MQDLCIKIVTEIDNKKNQTNSSSS